VAIGRREVCSTPIPDPNPDPNPNPNPSPNPNPTPTPNPYPCPNPNPDPNPSPSPNPNPNQGVLYPGEVLAMNREDDTVDLLYDDGDFESHVPRERLHAVSIELTDRHACSQPSRTPASPHAPVFWQACLQPLQPSRSPLAALYSPLQPPTAPYTHPSPLLAASTPSVWATWSRSTSRVMARGTPAASSPSIPSSASSPSSTR
jgi:hypothetical protein